MGRTIDADKFILALMDASLSSVDEDTILDLVDSIPTADVTSIEALERLRDELYEQDLITMEGLKRLNALIGEYTAVHEGGERDNG